MKKTILVICSAVLMAACNNTTNNTEKDMNTLTFNEKQASCISTIACYEAQGNLEKLAESEGVKHWHGASKDSWMQHLTYHKDVKENASNEWLEPVSDEQYEQL